MHFKTGGFVSPGVENIILRFWHHQSDITLGHFTAIAAQLGLLLFVAHVYELEQSQSFSRILPVIFVGFCVHAWLPRRYRLLFFLLLSFAGIWAVMGVMHGLLLVGLGLGLFAICHLPVNFRLRILLLLLVAVGLAAARGEWIPTPSRLLLPTMVLPILGAMFMFRIIIYLYDLRHEKQGTPLSQRLAYFFMLPNICFPLFPVVDYQRFLRTYYDKDARDIYQQGILWMFRGVAHLLLYRLVYHHFTLSPSEVAGFWDVWQYMLATYLLYLRISGQFHLIVGIMCLFGFNLPETHHLFYLASSFSDYWRRINIYWKDFMLKIFYYPSLMKLRRWGMTIALVASTSVVFFSTWLLHGYQWFWLRGTFPVTAPDALFWGILGGLVIINSLAEAKKSSTRRLGKKEFEPVPALVHACKVVGMFVFITVLWSLWSSPTLGAWAQVMGRMFQASVADVALLITALTALVGIGVLVPYMRSRGWGAERAMLRHPFGRSVALTSACLAILLAIGRPDIYTSFEGRTAAALVALTTSGFNQQDEQQVERGYYEGLLNTEKLTSALMFVQTPKDWKGLRQAGIAIESEDVLNYQLKSNLSVEFKRVPFRTNTWGMRDKEYAAAKPGGAFRVVMLGSSYAMGAGVENEAVFEALLEERLQSSKPWADIDTYEILNLSVGAYSILHNAVMAQRNTFRFEPDAVFVVLHSTEKLRLVAHLRELVAANIIIADSSLASILKRSGARRGMRPNEIEERLMPHLDEVIDWSLHEIAAQCRRHDVLPVAVVIPTVNETDWKDEELSSIDASAREAGFHVLSIEGVFDGQDREAMQVAPWDTHPSALAHRLIAERMYDAMVEHERTLGLVVDEQAADPVY